MTDTCPLCAQTLPAGLPIIFDLETGFIIVNRQAIYLTATEAEIFAVLWDRRPRMVTQDAIMNAVYQLRQGDPDDQIVKVLVCNMRSKLKGTGVEIITDRGRGFRLRLPTQEGRDD